MNEEIKKVLENSLRMLKSKGGMNNKEVKPVMMNIEKLIKRKTRKRIGKRA
jgi:ElaB/YqjD/DUF883 family membrane-anchored ribosome-binding protein